MAATASPIIPNSGNNISAPTPIPVELSAAPGQVTELHLPENATTHLLQITTFASGHDIDVGFESGGETINIATGEVWSCPVALVASQRLYLSSTHASAEFTVLIGRAP